MLATWMNGLDLTPDTLAARMAAMKPGASAKSSISTRARPISLAVCASLPAVSGKPHSATSLLTARHVLGKGVRLLIASRRSTRAMTSSVSRAFALVIRAEGENLPSRTVPTALFAGKGRRPKGCGIHTRPPWPLIRSIVSPGGSPLGTSSDRNSPIISPCVVLISSPTMTRMVPESRSLSAPAIVLWSVTATQSRPAFRLRSATSVRRVAQSYE